MMRILSNDILPTAGEVWMGGRNLLSDCTEVRKMIGYCPQQDNLLANLSAREHLQLFARIKCVKKSEINRVVELLIQRIGLQSGIEDRVSKGYSGGNKRKLCVGMALIGRGSVLMLDGKTNKSNFLHSSNLVSSHFLMKYFFSLFQRSAAASIRSASENFGN